MIFKTKKRKNSRFTFDLKATFLTVVSLSSVFSFLLDDKFSAQLQRYASKKINPNCKPRTIGLRTKKQRESKEVVCEIAQVLTHQFGIERL